MSATYPRFRHFAIFEEEEKDNSSRIFFSWFLFPDYRVFINSQAFIPTLSLQAVLNLRHILPD